MSRTKTGAQDVVYRKSSSLTPSAKADHLRTDLKEVERAAVLKEGGIISVTVLRKLIG